MDSFSSLMLVDGTSYNARFAQPDEPQDDASEEFEEVPKRSRGRRRK